MQINNCTSEDVEYTVNQPGDRTDLEKLSHRTDPRLVKGAVVEFFPDGGANPFPDTRRLIEVDDPVVTLVKLNDRYLVDITEADPAGPVSVNPARSENSSETPTPKPVGVSS